MGQSWLSGFLFLQVWAGWGRLGITLSSAVFPYGKRVGGFWEDPSGSMQVGSS